MKDLNSNFPRALPDLIYLLDRDYPKKPSIEIVGNRYSLSADERMILYRGVFRTELCLSRREKLRSAESVGGSVLVVDGCNVLITLESYLSGRRVFRALDGFVRDTAGVYGNYRFGEGSMRSTLLLLEFAERFRPCRLVVYLDSPVSGSGEYAHRLRGMLDERKLEGVVEAVKSPDRRILKEHTGDPVGEYVGEYVASSDTVIIDGVASCVDVPGLIIREVFGGEPLDLGNMAGPSR